MGRQVCRAAVELVKSFEGLRLAAYICPAGKPTIGYGHTQGVTIGDHITEEQAENYLQNDLNTAGKAVERLVTVALSDGQFGALASFVFNLGEGNLKASTLLKELNVGDYAGAAGEFDKWVKATVNGEKVTLPGLVKRRKAEKELFMSDAVPASGHCAFRVIEEGGHRFTQIGVMDEPGSGGACHEYIVVPAQGFAPEPFATVFFQNGPVKENGVNGCHQEDLLLIVADRLKSFQAGPFACEDNAEALGHIRAALECLGRRTKARQERGVEGRSVA